MNINQRTDEFVTIFWPERQACENVVVKRPIASSVEVAVEKAAYRIAIAYGVDIFCNWKSVGIAMFIFRTVDGVMLVAEKETI